MVGHGFIITTERNGIFFAYKRKQRSKFYSTLYFSIDKRSGKQLPGIFKSSLHLARTELNLFGAVWHDSHYQSNED